MLYKQTVETQTLERLIVLMKLPQLQDFFLVGGTALSLLIGHRISIDIDLFTKNAFDENSLAEYLERAQKMQLNYIAKQTIKGTINNIKVDLIAHQYPLVNELSVIDNIRFASFEDIAAMKLNAIIGKGTRLKYFVDIAFLSTQLSLKKMIDAYSIKYSSRNPAMAIKALSYHQDINFNEPIMLLNNRYQWKPIEKRINEMIKDPNKIFANTPIYSN